MTPIFPVTSTPTDEKTRSVDTSRLSLDSKVGDTTNADAIAEPASPLSAQETATSPMSPIETSPLSASASKEKTCAPRAMASALRTSLSRSSSRSSSPNRVLSTHHPQRSHSGTQAGQISLDAALGAGKGIGRIVGAGLKSPMDFTLGLARGFHNAPKLYGDESVRQADKVTDLQSGLKAAGKVLTGRLRYSLRANFARNLDLDSMTASRVSSHSH